MLSGARIKCMVFNKRSFGETYLFINQTIKVALVIKIILKLKASGEVT